MHKTFFGTTAVVELLAGVSLLLLPGTSASLLFGVALESPASELICRMAGSALLAWGVACHLARQESRGPAARALTAGMLVYNSIVLAIFVYAGTAAGLFGMALWPAAALHAGMSVWNLACLRAHSGNG